MIPQWEPWRVNTKQTKKTRISFCDREKSTPKPWNWACSTIRTASTWGRPARRGEVSRAWPGTPSRPPRPRSTFWDRGQGQITRMTSVRPRGWARCRRSSRCPCRNWAWGHLGSRKVWSQLRNLFKSYMKRELRFCVLISHVWTYIPN